MQQLSFPLRKLLVSDEKHQLQRNSKYKLYNQHHLRLQRLPSHVNIAHSVLAPINFMRLDIMQQQLDCTEHQRILIHKQYVFHSNFEHKLIFSLGQAWTSMREVILQTCTQRQPRDRNWTTSEAWAIHPLPARATKSWFHTGHGCHRSSSFNDPYWSLLHIIGYTSKNSAATVAKGKWIWSSALGKLVSFHFFVG